MQELSATRSTFRPPTHRWYFCTLPWPCLPASSTLGHQPGTHTGFEWALMLTTGSSWTRGPMTLVVPSNRTNKTVFPIMATFDVPDILLDAFKLSKLSGFPVSSPGLSIARSQIGQSVFNSRLIPARQLRIICSRVLPVESLQCYFNLGFRMI